MNRYQSSSRWLALGATVTLSVAAAQFIHGTASAYDKSDFLAPEGKALVVFIQNQKADRKMTFTVFESDKRCVAEVEGRQAEILAIDPEPLLFYVVGYNKTRRIEIFPLPGRTYFVRLHTVTKSMGQAPEVTLVRRASEQHKLLGAWLEGAIVARAIDDESCYARPLRERENRTNRRLNEANAEWKNGDEAYRDRYRLIERDGFTHEDIGRL